MLWTDVDDKSLTKQSSTGSTNFLYLLIFCKIQSLTKTTLFQKIPGVIAFFSAKDIPGKNTFTSLDVPWQDSEEEIFASTKTRYYGQPIGVIAAVTHKLALSASELVKVQYKNSEEPVLTIRQALLARDKERRVSSLLLEPYTINCHTSSNQC